MRLSLPWFLGVSICIIFVALFLRLAPISNESVDGDEMFSRHVAMSEASRALNLVRQDLVHPPLYYLLLKETLPKGSPAFALDIRFLSLAAGVASIMIVILAGSLVAPLRGPAILAAFLLALNKTHIFYSQQARSYALFCFLAGMLLLWGLLLDRYERDWMYWLAGTTLMTALLYTHYFGAFYCAAVILPVVLAKSPKRLKILAVASGVFAFTVFLPWVYQEVPVYRGKSGISSILAWQGLPTFFNLKMTFADDVGILDFRGATSLAFLIGAVLICCALLLPNSRNEEEVLNFRIRLTLALTALMPPVLMFVLTWRPLRLPIFGERHVLPSMAATLLLVSYGLWRLAARASKPLRVLVLVIGAIILSVFQALPVWSNWPGPSREPYAVIADWLEHTDLNLPVYTTWPYGIGEPVAFYLERSRQIDELPGCTPNGQCTTDDPMKLPDRFIVLYRPAAQEEDYAVHSLLNRFSITEEKYYSAHNSRWGTRLLVLQER
ncbi:MAG: hypothetical protein ABSE40_21365 [Candidatus Sulfotelmatobacter sp.]|jgi:hypothetical protein